MTWYKDAVVYQVHVRAFRDGDADGIGDFPGLIRKLDYLQDLGVNTLWLLPFYPSPMRDDGYDIADYTSINPAYGTLRDFTRFLEEAHRQGLRVITELVLNHTSGEHPWFQRARRAPAGSPERDFYVWSDTPDRYREARIIFKDFETSNWAWDPVAGRYYWHRFYSHQPDLNYENPEVREAMVDVVDFWLDLGVDGLRLDALPYLFEQEGTDCENLPETHEFLRELRKHVDHRFGDRILLAEANQWPDDAAAYFGTGDGAHMSFHFPLMPRMFMATRMEDRYPILDILAQTPEIPEECQWAVFLRNHDELTLEMVTDEERDYMYRAYAEEPEARINLGIRRRLAPLLGNNRRMMEILNGLLFSLPGTPVVYYGDEIGMGDNIHLGDRDGVRNPMQWSAERNAGFSTANPERLYPPVITDTEYDAHAVNVESQQRNPHSLLWWTKRLIDLRRRYRALGRGTLRPLYPDNRKVLAFVRIHGDEQVLVVANLSRRAQYVELDLSEFDGMTPVELFGATDFPQIGTLPYLLTLGPHGFYWFSLERQRQAGPARAQVPTIEVEGSWEEIFSPRDHRRLEEALPAFLRTRRWFGGKARAIKGAEIVDSFPVDGPGGNTLGRLVLVRTDYGEGEPDTYLATLTAARPERAAEVEEAYPDAVVVRLDTAHGARALHDATWEPDLSRALLESISRGRSFRGSSGEVICSRTDRFPEIDAAGTDPRVSQGEQSNTSIAYDDRLILKLFRRPQEGVNPEVEVGAFLTRRGFAHIPPLAGTLEYRREDRPAMSLGVLQGLVSNEGDAWAYTLDSLETFVDRALASSSPPPPATGRFPSGAPPPTAVDTIGAYLDAARLIGRRTAELHLALSGEAENPAFAPEPLSALDRRALYESMRALTARVFRLVRARTEDPEVLGLEEEVAGRFRRVLDLPGAGARIRVHGDLHLGQVLWTGKDFVFIDFEGEPARPLSERRLKRSPLRDVAGMLRSFDYAARAMSLGRAHGVVPPRDRAAAEPWLRMWRVWVSASYLRSYLETLGNEAILPTAPEVRAELLDVFLLERALYELGYEADNRPDWLDVPVRGIRDLLRV